MTLSPLVFIKPFIDFVVGKVIEAGTAGDKVKQAARATELLAINNALAAIDKGDVGGAAALAAAISGNTAFGPGEAMALQSLLAIVGNDLAAIKTVEGATLLGGIAETIVTSILTEGSAVAQAYIAAAPAA